MKKRKSFNPKRKIEPVDYLSKEERAKLAQRAKYGGNPEHKMTPGD
jgi:hypothetical protein